MEQLEKKRLSLYDLQALAFRTELELEDNGGELTPEIEEALATTEEQIPRKVDAYKGYLDFLKTREAQLDQAIKDLQAKKKAVANTSSRVRDYVATTMKAFGLEKIKGDIYTASLSKRAGLEIDEETVLSPYRERMMRMSEGLPSYISVEMKISKSGASTAVKGLDVLPAGMARTESEVLTIR